MRLENAFLPSSYNLAEYVLSSTAGTLVPGEDRNGLVTSQWGTLTHVVE
jgi:hypothetical protein